MPFEFFKNEADYSSKQEISPEAELKIKER